MTEITGITGFTYDRDRFPKYYDGSKLLFDEKGEAIDLSKLDISDEEKSTYIEKYWNVGETTRTQVGTKIDPKSKRPFPTEPVFETTKEPTAKNLRSVYYNRLVTAGVKPEVAKELVLPQENVDVYGNVTYDDSRFLALQDVEGKGLGSDTIINTIQGIKKAGVWTAGELGEFLTGGLFGRPDKESRRKLYDKTSEFIETKAAPAVISKVNDLLGTDIDGTVPTEKAMQLLFGFKDTSEIMADQYEDLLDLSPSQMDYFMNPDGSRRPGETLKSGAYKGVEILVESAPFVVALTAKGVQTSTMMVNNFNKWIYRKLKKEGIDTKDSKSFNKALEKAPDYVDEFIGDYNKGRPFKKFLNWWYKGRLKSGMSFDTAAANRVAADNLYKKITKQKVDLKALKEKLASGKGNTTKIQEDIRKLQIQINKNAFKQVDYFKEGIPKYIREEGMSESGAIIGGAAFSELTQNTWGQIFGELSGGVFTPMGLGAFTIGTIKKLQNIPAGLADGLYRLQGESFNNKRWLFGWGSTGDYPFLMDDPTSLGDAALGIPKGKRKATQKEIAALNQIRDGLGGLGVELESEIITGTFQTLDEFKTVERALVESGMEPEEAFNIVRDSLGVMMSISPLQTFMRVQATQLKRKDILRIEGGVKKIIQLNNANKQLDQNLVEIIQKLGGIEGGYKGTTDINDFIDGLKRVQASLKQNQLDTEYDFAIEALDIMHFIIGGGDVSKMDNAVLAGNFQFMTEFLENTQAGKALLSGQGLNSISDAFDKKSADAIAKIQAMVTSNATVKVKLADINTTLKSNLFTKKTHRYNEFNKLKSELGTEIQRVYGDRGAIDLADFYKETKGTLNRAGPTGDWANANLTTSDQKLLRDIFEEPAKRKVEAFFKALQLHPETGAKLRALSLDEYTEQIALKLGKDPNKFKALDLWEHFETLKTIDKGGKPLFAGILWKQYRGLDLKFDETHRLKIGFDQRINKTKNEPVIEQLQEGKDYIKNAIDTFIKESGDEDLINAHKAYNRYYNLEISVRYNNDLGKGLGVTSAAKISDDVSFRQIELPIENYINIKALSSNDAKTMMIADRAHKKLWGTPAPADFKTQKVFDDVTKKETTLSKSGVVDDDGFMWQEGADLDFFQSQIQAKMQLWFQTTKSATALRVGGKELEEQVIGDLKKQGIIVKDLADLSRIEQSLTIKVLSKDGDKVFIKKLVDMDKIIDESIGYKAMLKDKKKYRKMWKEANDLHDNNAVKMKIESDYTMGSQMNTLKYNANEIQNLSGTAAPKDFLSKYGNDPSSLYDLREQLTTVKRLAKTREGMPMGKVEFIESTGIKDANGNFVKTQKEAEKIFDETVKKIFITGILDDVTSGTSVVTDKILRKDLYETFSDVDGIKIKKDRIQRIKDGIVQKSQIVFGKESVKATREAVTLDAKKLYQSLSDNEVLLTQQIGNYPPIMEVDDYNLLKEFALTLKKKQGLSDAIATRVSDIPHGFSLPSLVSRVYAMARQVISPKYVLTEAGILRARINNLNFINEVLENPAAAETLLELLKHDVAKPIGVDLNRRVYDVVLSVLAKESFLEEGVIEDYLSEQMDDLLAVNE